MIIYIYQTLSVYLLTIYFVLAIKWRSWSMLLILPVYILMKICTLYCYLCVIYPQHRGETSDVVVGIVLIETLVHHCTAILCQQGFVQHAALQIVVHDGDHSIAMGHLGDQTISTVFDVAEDVLCHAVDEGIHCDDAAQLIADVVDDASGRVGDLHHVVAAVIDISCGQGFCDVDGGEVQRQLIAKQS